MSSSNLLCILFQMEEKPFVGLKISSSDFLNTLENRTICPKCMKSRKFYCYNCFVPVKGIEDLIPRVQVGCKKLLKQNYK